MIPMPFLHRIYTFEVKIRPALKKFMIFISQSREGEKWVWLAKIVVAVNYYCKMLHHRFFTGVWICLAFSACQSSEYTSILNIPLVLNMPRFWIYQVFEYAYGSQYTRVLNKPGLHRVLNMSKFTRMAFVLHVTNVTPCLLERVITYFNKVYSLKEHVAIFVKGQNLIFQ